MLGLGWGHWVGGRRQSQLDVAVESCVLLGRLNKIHKSLRTLELNAGPVFTSWACEKGPLPKAAEFQLEKLKIAAVMECICLIMLNTESEKYTKHQENFLHVSELLGIRVSQLPILTVISTISCSQCLYPQSALGNYPTLGHCRCSHHLLCPWGLSHCPPFPKIELSKWEDLGPLKTNK